MRCPRVGSADALAIQLIGDQPGGTSPTVTLYLDHSGDRPRWIVKSTLLSAVALPANTVVVQYASDNGSTPLRGFVRLRLSIGGTTTTARIQLRVTGRTT